MMFGNDTSDAVARYEQCLDMNFFTSMFSLVVCFALLAACLAKKELREFPGGIIHWAVFCDVMFSVKFLVGASVWKSRFPSTSGYEMVGHSFNFYDDGCRLETMVGQFFSVASVMWNLVWVFDFTMALRNPIRAPTHCVMLPYHACVWLVAACTTLYVTALKYYEPGPDGWCSTQPNRKTGWTFLYLVWITAVVGLLSWVYACCRLSQGKKDSRKARLEKLMHHGAYVFIFAGCWMLVGIHRMDESLDNMTWLLRLDVFGMTAQAGLLALTRLVPVLLDTWRDAFVEFEDEEARRPLLTNVHPPGQILAELPAIRPVEEAGHPILPPASVPGCRPGIKRRASSWSLPVEIRVDFERSLLECVLSAVKQPPDADSARFSAKASLDDAAGSMPDGTKSKVFEHATFCAMRSMFGIAPDFIQECFPPSQFNSSDGVGAPPEFESSRRVFHSIDGAQSLSLTIISSSEARAMIGIVPSYEQYIRQSAHTLLPKWFGLYCISRPLSDDVYALLMGNPLSELVPGARLEEVYHLSGLREAAAASSSSTSSPPQASGKSRASGNDGFRSRYGDVGLQLGPDAADTLLAVLQTDVEFLVRSKFVDYSLMLAVFHTGGNPALLPEEADAAPQRPDRFTVGGNTYVFALDTLTELKGARRLRHTAPSVAEAQAYADRLLAFVASGLK